jgi:hypothetical protein
VVPFLSTTFNPLSERKSFREDDDDDDDGLSPFLISESARFPSLSILNEDGGSIDEGDEEIGDEEGIVESKTNDESEGRFNFCDCFSVTNRFFLSYFLLLDLRNCIFFLCLLLKSFIVVAVGGGGKMEAEGEDIVSFLLFTCLGTLVVEMFCEDLELYIGRFNLDLSLFHFLAE